jgi:DNA-binding GntR family transcriptional regulator
MKSNPVIKRSKTISEKVLRILENEILSGNYKPGSRLIEREIAESLGVSRVPVREALMTLERWGFVKEKEDRKKGREIVELSKRDIKEFYHIREFIEGYAFSEKSLQNDRRLSASLKKMIEEMEEFAIKKDVESYRNMNSRFHHEFVRALNNRKLYKMYREISKTMRWFQALTLYVPRMKPSNLEHKLLLKAYEEQDIFEIRRLFKKHYDQAVELLAKKLDVIQRKET